MADRGGERTKSRDVDELLAEVESTDATADDDTIPDDESRQRTSRTNERNASLRERAGELFSLRVFLVALVLTAVGVALLGSVSFLGGLLGFVGVFLAGFVLGAASADRHYLEVGLAGGVVTGVSALSNYFLLTVVGAGLVVVAANVGIGVLAGVMGHYFGRDFRDGLTRDL